MSQENHLNHALTKLEIYCLQRQWEKLPELVSELRLGFESLLRTNKVLVEQNQTLLQKIQRLSTAQEKLRQINSSYLDIYVSSLNSFKKYQQAIELVQGTQSLQELSILLINIKKTLGLKTLILILKKELFSGLLPPDLPTIDKNNLKQHTARLSALLAGNTSYLGPPPPKEALGPILSALKQEYSSNSSCFLSVLFDKYEQNEPLGLLFVHDQDPNRFSPDKATDFLEHFCLTLSSSLRTLRDHDYLLQHNTLDTLTGAHNRTYLQRQARIILNLAERKKIAVSLMFIDLNKFKEINDTLGHKAGDEVLIKVSRAIKSMIRKYDCLIRYGGDEFVLLLPGTDLHNAKRLKKRLLQEIARINVKQGKLPFALSAAIGLAEYSPGQSLESLLDEADAQMYRDKKSRHSSPELITQTA